MQKKIITLSKLEDLKIFMSPIRQKLLRFMHIEGRPMTTKKIADRLNISPSSAKHHLAKLESLGLIELSHTELINGITARYYKVTDVNVNIGSQYADGLTDERRIIVQNLINSTLDGLRSLKELYLSKDQIQDFGDFRHGIVHLTPADSKKLQKIIQDFVDTHESKSEDTEPWEYALVFYNAGLLK